MLVDMPLGQPGARRHVKVLDVVLGPSRSDTSQGADQLPLPLSSSCIGRIGPRCGSPSLTSNEAASDPVSGLRRSKTASLNMQRAEMVIGSIGHWLVGALEFHEAPPKCGGHVPKR